MYYYNNLATLVFSSYYTGEDTNGGIYTLKEGFYLYSSGGYNIAHPQVSALYCDGGMYNHINTALNQPVIPNYYNTNSANAEYTLSLFHVRINEGGPSYSNSLISAIVIV